MINLLITNKPKTCAARFISTLSLAVLILWPLNAQLLKQSEVEKLDPQFRTVLAKHLPAAGLNTAADDRNPASIAPDGSPLYDAIITTSQPEAVRAAGIRVNSSFKTFVTAQLRPTDLLSLVKLDAVRYIDPGSINYPQVDISVPEIGVSLLHAGFLNNTPYRGKGVIVVVYDTGIDWMHHDFRVPGDTTKTRILFIWDQTLTADPSRAESPPLGFTYGVEYTKAQIEDELDGSPTGFVRERDVNGHGTHVAGIAAGNGLSLNKKYVGVAPEADLIVVKGGDGSFSETRMIDGLTYARNKAELLRRPVVVNWSIGGHSGPHDGTRAYEVAVDDFVSTPGRVVAISAGNDGSSSIHFAGNIATGSSTSVTITVPAFTANSGTNNDRFTLEVWFDGNPSLTATVTSPGGITVTRNGVVGEPNQHPDNTDGTIDFRNYQSSLNGHRSVFLDVRDADASRPPKNGTWTLTFSNASSSASFDGWIYTRTVGAQVVSVEGANSQKTVSMPATARGAITVASYVTKWSWPTFDSQNFTYSTTSDRTGDYSTFTSIGPTRDGRQKPDIAAPGQGITAALSSLVNISTVSTRVHPGMKHYLIQGTSMASPHIAGVAALLLSANPGLTAAQIKSLLTANASVDLFTGTTPNVIWGYGKVDALRAMAKVLNPAASVERTTLAYDAAGGSAIFSPFLTGSTKYAVRFTPTFSGRLTGMQLNITTAANAPIVGSGPLVCEVYTNTAGSVSGIPGSKLGNSVMHPFEQLSTGTNNYIDMTSANVLVNAGQDYHLVISVANSSDLIKVRADDVVSPTSRSSVFDGTRWVNVHDPASGQTTVRNLRMRAVVTSVSGLVSVQTTNELPATFELRQNYPNPFNPATSFEFTVPSFQFVELRVYDLLGREVALLVNELLKPGTYRVNWSAGELSTGVYYYRMRAGSFTETKKAVLLK